MRSLVAELRAEATAFVRSCAPTEPILTEAKAFMRYSGQGWEIPVELGELETATAAEMLHRFETDYEKLFGRAVTGMDVEITVWSVNATTQRPPVTRVERLEGTVTATPEAHRPIFDAALGAPQQAAVHSRTELQPGIRVDGPAAVVEDETTIIVPTSRCAIRQPDGCIELRLKDEAAR